MIMPILGFNLILILGYGIGATIGYRNGIKVKKTV